MADIFIGTVRSLYTWTVDLVMGLLRSAERISSYKHMFSIQNSILGLHSQSQTQSVSVVRLVQIIQFDERGTCVKNLSGFIT